LLNAAPALCILTESVGRQALDVVIFASSTGPTCTWQERAASPSS